MDHVSDSIKYAIGAPRSDSVYIKCNCGAHLKVGYDSNRRTFVFVCDVCKTLSPALVFADINLSFEVMRCPRKKR